MKNNYYVLFFKLSTQRFHTFLNFNFTIKFQSPIVKNIIMCLL